MILKYKKNDVIFGVIKDCYVFKETILNNEQIRRWKDGNVALIDNWDCSSVAFNDDKPSVEEEGGKSKEVQ